MRLPVHAAPKDRLARHDLEECLIALSEHRVVDLLLRLCIDCRHGVELLHQAHEVQLSPELHDLAARDPIENAAWDLN